MEAMLPDDRLLCWNCGQQATHVHVTGEGDERMQPTRVWLACPRCEPGGDWDTLLEAAQAPEHWLRILDRLPPGGLPDAPYFHEWLRDRVPPEEPPAAPEAPESASDGGWLTVADAAATVKRSRRTIYKAIHAGDLRASHVGRRYHLKRADLDAWLERNVTQPRRRQRPSADDLAGRAADDLRWQP